MKEPKNLTTVRYFVRIRTGNDRCLAQCVYYRGDLSPEIIAKWRWYFEYLEAKIKVKYPKHYIELTIENAAYIPPKNEMIIWMENKIKFRQHRIQLMEKNVGLAIKNWTKLFPIEETEDYKVYVKKIEKYKSEISMFTKELKALKSENNYKYGVDPILREKYNWFSFDINKVRSIL